MSKTKAKTQTLTPAVKKEVTKMINKKIDVAVKDKLVRYNFASNIGTSGIVLPIALLTKGTEQYNRIGNFIRGKSINVKGTFKGDSTPANMRCIVGLYKNVSGALPAVSSILRDYSNAGTAASVINSEYNQENREEFLIFSDKMYSLSGFTGISRLAAGTANQTADSFAHSKWVVLNEYFKCHHETSYVPASNAGTIADVQEGLPFVLLISDNNTNLPTYDLSVKYKFEDA